MKKKQVLIISYYWPPAGGPGVQRWLKFVKYLPKYNIQPIVYVPENANYPILDDSLLDDIPSEAIILKQPIKEPYKLANLFSNKTERISKGIIADDKNQSFIEKLMLYIRGNFFIPDARVNWVKPSVNYLLSYILEHGIDTIITTGPPHSVHLIGEQLKEQLGVKWFADFRDPWTTIGYHKQLRLTEASQEKHKILEKRVLNAADVILVTSGVTKKEFQYITKRPIHVITNGYDLEIVKNYILDCKFSIAHIGSLLSKRNPKVLWEVIRDLVKERADFATDFELNLVGTVSDEIYRTFEKYRIDSYLNKIGYIAHNEAIRFQQKSQVLLQIEIDSEDTKCIIPGKLFEYMVSGRPIIAIGPEGSDVEHILNNTQTGNYFLYNDYDGLKTKILEHYSAFKKGQLKAKPINTEAYSRKALTGQLAELLH